MTFYWISGSPYAWRAMLALEYKGIKYESLRLDPSKKEQKSAEYLAINPRGKVPALQDGDVTVYESLAIIAYVERLQPEPNLLGSDAREAAAVMQCICELDNYGFKALFEIIGPIMFADSDPQLSDIEDGIAAGYDELQLIEDRLSTSTYLASDRVTAADIVFVPMLQYLLRAAGKQTLRDDGLGFLPLDKQYPRVAQWQKRIEVMPGYDAAYPPHWRE